MRPLLAFLLIAFIPAARSANAAESFRPVYEHGSGELVPDQVFGSEDESDDAFIMSSWLGFAVAGSGDVYVLEMQLCLVKHFDSTGTLVDVFGEEGEGPASLRQPLKIAVGPDGRVWIYELGNRRFSVFGPDGRFIETHPFQETVWDMGVSSRGSVYAKLQLADYTGKWGGSRHRLIQFSKDMRRYTVVDSAVIKDNIYITDPVGTNVPVPFCDRFLWGLSPEGNVIVATTKNFGLKAWSDDLEVLYEVHHEIERQRVTEEDQERFFAGITTSHEGVVTSGAPDYIRDNTVFPERKPAFRSMLVDHEGYVLLQTFEGDEDSQVWLVFEPNGTFLGRAELPLAGATLSGGYVYRIMYRDEYNSVERFRLVVPEQATKQP
jgi:hypothetical protein